MSLRTIAEVVISIHIDANSKEPQKERRRLQDSKAIASQVKLADLTIDWLKALHSLIGWFKWTISFCVQF